MFTVVASLLHCKIEIITDTFPLQHVTPVFGATANLKRLQTPYFPANAKLKPCKL